MFRIVAQGDLVSQQENGYSSFPCLALDPLQNQVFAFYRRAVYDENDERYGMKAHGLDGNLYYKWFLPDSQSFSQENILYKAQDYPPSLIDGVPTNLGDELFLFFRRFPHPDPIFYTHGSSIEELGPTQQLAADPRLILGAQWGHVIDVPQADGSTKWLQSFYGAVPGYVNEEGKPPKMRPAVYQSLDKGKTWEFLEWITPHELLPDISANETTLVYAEGTVTALMRTAGEFPGALFFAQSKDEGKTWSSPKRTGLYGEAPMFYKLPNGNVLVCYRGINPDDPENPGLGGTFSLAVFDPYTNGFREYGIVETYAGDHYDGGYGDLIWVESIQKLLVVYYYSDKPTPRNPWLRYALLEFPEP